MIRKLEIKNKKISQVPRTSKKISRAEPTKPMRKKTAPLEKKNAASADKEKSSGREKAKRISGVSPVLEKTNDRKSQPKKTASPTREVDEKVDKRGAPKPIQSSVGLETQCPEPEPLDAAQRRYFEWSARALAEKKQLTAFLMQDLNQKMLLYYNSLSIFSTSQLLDDLSFIFFLLLGE